MRGGSRAETGNRGLFRDAVTDLNSADFFSRKSSLRSLSIVGDNGVMGRVNFRAYEPGLSRKIACGSWRTAGDPSVYALLEIEMSKALEFAAAYSRQHGVRITPTLLAAKAITHCLQVRPELNGLLRHGKVYLRRNVSIFFQVNVPGRVVEDNRDERIAKAVLSGTTVHETETKSLAEIARAFRVQAASEDEIPPLGLVSAWSRCSPGALSAAFSSLAVGWFTA